MQRGKSRHWLVTIRGLADFAVVGCGEAHSAATAGWEMSRTLNFMKNGEVCVTLAFWAVLTLPEACEIRCRCGDGVTQIGKCC
ncbi:MAG: hypothetical protein RLZZ232_3825 [Planctomycetota bacterium]|jgi:hypothetical protein